MFVFVILLRALNRISKSAREKKKLELQEICDALLRKQELLDAENDIEAVALKARILEAGIDNARISAEHESVLSAPSSKTVWMDEQKEMLPPAATRPLELITSEP